MLALMSFDCSLTKCSIRLVYSLQSLLVNAHHFISSCTGGWRAEVIIFSGAFVHSFSSYKSIRSLRADSISYRSCIPHPILSVNIR